MAGYKVFFKKSVEKDFKNIPNADLRRIIKLVGSLAENSFPAGCEKLTGQVRYRVRQGRYRIVYSIEDSELTVWVVKVAHRKDVYR
ncbi:MAG: type II toxin-antitoxin system RelE/ParE family toxin [Desulfobulbaceae bacterium]|nr:type II toxin-antitoxin system RelE/ParE family toxin [Desulfobulbaceae bacterium]